MRKNKFLALTMLCSVLSGVSANAQEIKGPHLGVETQIDKEGSNDTNKASITFRDICRSSAKGTATVVRHVTSWIATVLSVVSMVYVYSSGEKTNIGFYAVYTGFAAWGILNTCDMIYEYKESKSDKNEKPTSNNHGEFDTAKAQDKKDSPYLQ